MNSGYIAIIHELFPNTKVIIDRFHVVQLLSRAFNKTRVQYMNKLNTTSPDQKKYRRLKYYWRLFLKKATNLNYTDYKDYHLFGQRTQSGILEEMLGHDDLLRSNYDVFQALLKAINDDDMDKLKAILEADHDGLSGYLKTAIKTLTKHLDYIQNTFKYPYSNGRIEGNHNKIKLINRVAYGHRNMANFTNRIILQFNLRLKQDITSPIPYN